MKAILYSEPGALAVTTIPDPEATDGHVILRVEACGMCHTDIDVLHGRYGPGTYPLVPGHEYTGTVVDAAADVVGFATGDRVVVDPNIECGICRPCRKGLANMCESLRATGVTQHGGFAELSSVPAANLVRLPDEVPFGLGALAEPIGCVLNGLEQARANQNVENAVVFGAGPIGTLMGIALQHLGVAEVCVADLDDSRLAQIQTMGLTPLRAGSSDLEGRERSFDLTVDATGVAAVAERLPSYTATGGTALLFGVCKPTVGISVEPYEIFRRQLSVVGAHSLNHNIDDALEVVAGCRDKVAKVISHDVELSQMPEFLNQLNDAPTMKVQYRRSS